MSFNTSLCKIICLDNSIFSTLFYDSMTTYRSSHSTQFPNGNEDEMYGIILIDKLNETVEIQKMAHDDFSHIVTVDEQNEARNSVNDMRREEGLPFLTEEEWPSATTEFTTTFFADHAISKIVEGYNSGKILKEGISVWY